MLTRCYRHGMPVPDRIANAPELPLGMELYYNAYLELSTCRQSGWGPAPIPWVAILDYSRTFEFDDEQQDDLFFFVRALDKAFLNYHKEKADQGKG